jgi:hypothetical protein
MNKEYILDEIKRTAKEHGGTPLGWARFEQETGIRHTEWYGKIWARWSDALVEAGYLPNKLQGALDERVLIEQFISLIKELGKFPSPADYRLKAYKNKGFPSHSTILHRLGNQLELAKKILTYCGVNPTYSDVVTICKAKITSGAAEESHSSTDKSDIDFGYVYLMKSGRFYKIGCSYNVERRNYELGIRLPEDLAILPKIRTDDPIGIETYWHTRFKDNRKQGEWFDLSTVEILAFKRRKFM